MCVIIRETMNLYWIIGLQVLWSGVITTGNVTEAPGIGTTNSNEISAFIISIKITNHIYNDSLEDHQSQNYKILRQDVESMFFEIYRFAPSVQYQEISQMTFSNGSVIANSTVIFGTKQKNGQTVKNIFVTNYKHHHSLMLDLNISYTADQEPIPVPLSFLPNISHSTLSLTSSNTSPNTHINKDLPEDIHGGNENSTISTTSALTISGPDKSRDDNISTAAPPQTHSTTNGSGFTYTASQTTANSTSGNSSMTVHSSTFTSSTSTTNPTSSLLTMTVHSSSKVLTISGSSPSNMTEHPSSNISTISGSSLLNTTAHSSSNISTSSGSSPSNTTARPSSNISTSTTSSSSTKAVHPSSNISASTTSSSSTKAVHPSSNISTMSASSSSTTTVRPSSNISAMSAASSSVSPGKTVTQNPTGPEGPDTVATGQGVPGWGIAILVLAAIILFFMLVLLILLLLFWCCWWKQRGFMNVSEPDPMGYYNPDIPMYSTHSTYDSHNGKSLVSDSERPAKNRTGMYIVNK